MNRDALSELLGLQKQIARRLEERLTEARSGHTLRDGNVNGAFWPSVDLVETDDAFVLRAELAGFSAADAAVSLDGATLTIRGTRAPAGKRSKGSRVANRGADSAEKAFLRMERGHGSFQRSFTLDGVPRNADLTTRWADGVLEVIVSKRPAPAPSRPATRLKGMTKK